MFLGSLICFLFFLFFYRSFVSLEWVKFKGIDEGFSRFSEMGFPGVFSVLHNVFF